MRVQLQQQRGGRTTHHASLVLEAAGGVTTEEREIELTVRLEMPEETGADVGIDAVFDPPPPPTWEDSLQQRLYQGVQSGLANVGAPLPEGGIGVHLINIRILPPLENVAGTDDVQRLGETLEALTAATVSALWTGVITHGSTSDP